MSSAQPEDEVYLRHILDAITQINSYLEGVDRTRFDGTRLLQDAVVRQLEIVGEAAKRLSTDLREQSSSIPWRKITGMRDKLSHDYMGVDLNAVWLTATGDLPTLKEAVEGLLRSRGRGSNGV